MLTIGQLREHLDKLERDWNEGKYEEFFGLFENQPVVVDHYEKVNDDSGHCTYQGIGDAYCIASWDLGLCMLPENVS